ERNLSLERQRDVVPRQEDGLETIAALELCQRAVLIVIGVVAVHEVREATARADVDGGGDQRVGRPLVAMLLLADDLNELGARTDVDHPDVADELVAVVGAEKSVPVKIG